MTRLGRWAIGFAGVAAALPLVLAISVVVWACSALPDDMSPPDPAAVPESVRTLFWVEFGGSPGDVRALGLARQLRSFRNLSLRRDAGASVASYAASRLVEIGDPPIRQLRHALAGLLGSVWVSWQWSAGDALAAIALSSCYGHGFHGVHAASIGYFGKPVEALTLPQAAALIALTKSPKGYSPWCHRDRLVPRIATLLAAFPEENTAAALDELLPPAADACSSS